MRSRYDEQEVELTPRFLESLIEVMRAKCEMMAQAEPSNADCWVWGRCEISDLASNGGMLFQFGSAEDDPEDGLGDFAVLSNT